MLDLASRILIVDDSKVVRLGMHRVFSSLGYTNVQEAADGAEAVARHTAEPAHLILLDIVMPVISGTEALARIRVRDKTTPVIMLSSLAKESEIETCRRLGITDFIVKPLTAADAPAIMRDRLARL